MLKNTMSINNGKPNIICDGETIDQVSKFRDTETAMKKWWPEQVKQMMYLEDSEYCSTAEVWTSEWELKVIIALLCLSWCTITKHRKNTVKTKKKIKCILYEQSASNIEIIMEGWDTKHWGAEVYRRMRPDGFNQAKKIKMDWSHHKNWWHKNGEASNQLEGWSTNRGWSNLMEKSVLWKTSVKKQSHEKKLKRYYWMEKGIINKWTNLTEGTEWSKC